MTARPRLLVVSAHYPPNFVSGGTLVPARQARGLAERGWDVSVYAGHLGRSRRSLETWDEVIDGLPVRWIEIGDFIGWSDVRNFNNPDVAADFERHLAVTRPEVVHLHSLQALGAGLLTVAKRSGARTVVTMHDFWWCCGRQFLVDRSWTPCSFAVEAGVCSCEVDAAWRNRRHHHLLGVLEDADLILAPSAVAAEVLVANGIPLERLDVDENGLGSVPHSPSRRAGGATVTFRYTGGAEPMKGVGVLHRALQNLAATPDGWRLVVHGDPKRLSEIGPWPAPAEVAPPFPPDAVDAVMADTNVLVVPSIARESHSLITREALLRGVPVICSDSLGPEAVVENGVNGLIVPTGDAEALAMAMRRAVDEPEQRTRWAQAAPSVEVRLETDHLDELDRRLRQVLVADSARTDLQSSTSKRTGRVERVLFICGIDGAPLRYRAHLPAEAMALMGVRSDVRHYRDPSVGHLLGLADAVVVYRVPATIQIIELLTGLRARRPHVPVLFDVDDLIFDPDILSEVSALARLPEDEAALYLEGVQRYRTTMELCDGFIGSTEPLCQHASAVAAMPAHRFRNGIGLILGQASDAALRRPRAPGPLRVGYLSGTTTHDQDWAMIEPAVVDVLEAHPDVELWLGGHVQPTVMGEQLGPRLRRIPLTEWTALPGILRNLDVNLAPLERPSRFNESKSAIKWLEAALCATPTVASPTQPFTESIRHGSNGFLASSLDDWRGSLESLLSDPLLRGALGARARRDALLGWCPRVQGPRYLEILTHARDQLLDGHRRSRSSWPPVTRDEPPVPTPLAPYAPAAVDIGPRPLPGLLRRVRRALVTRLSAARRTWRERGARHTVRAIARGLRRDGRRSMNRIRSGR